MEGSILDNVTYEYAIDEVKGMIMGRLKKGQDLLNSIIDICQQHNVRAGSFNCIGSLLQLGYYQFHHGEDGSLSYSSPIIREEPAELLAGTGFIGFSENNTLDVHYHGTFIDAKGSISGGHFIRGKNPTAVTIEFVIHFSEAFTLQRKPDALYGFPTFHFIQDREE